MKSGTLNLLEPSGPLQACNGIVLLTFLHGTGAAISFCLQWQAEIMYKVWCLD